MIDKEVLEIVHKKFIEANVKAYQNGFTNEKVESLGIKKLTEDVKNSRASVVAMLLEKKKAKDNIASGFETLQKKQTSGESDMKPYLDAIKKSQDELQKLPSEPICDALVKYCQSLRAVADAYEILGRTSVYGIEYLSDTLFFV